MLKRKWSAESNGSYRTYLISGKTAALVPEFAVEDQPSAELQPRFLSLRRKTCLWAEHSWWWIWIRRRRVIGISGSLTWSKTLIELIFNSSGPWNLFRSFKVCSDVKVNGVRKGTGNYRTYSSRVKLQPWFLSLLWKSCLWAELQPWCLN